MKKLFSMILVIMLAFAFPAQVSAEETPTMESLANSIIEITTDNTNENPTTTYNNIEEFVNEVRNQIPDIDDLELANFIMDYTGQEDLEVADEETLKYLGFKEIIISEDYIKVDEAGNTESMTQDEMTLAMFRDAYGISPLASAEWNSPNGYMQIKTVLSRETGVLKDGNVGYQIATYGIWKKIPVCYYRDLLALCYTGSETRIDNSHEIYGKLEETIYCCQKTTNYKTQVWNNEGKDPYYTNKNVIVQSQGGGNVAITFQLMSTTGFQCNSGAQNHAKRVASILSYMSYGIKVKAGQNFEIQGAYAHKRLPGGNIGVSVSYKGIGLSVSLGGHIDKYIALQQGYTAYK